MLQPDQNCTRCALHSQRKQIVFGKGAIPPEVIIVGEAPGRTEDEGGEPFTGRSGILLTQLLLQNGLDRNTNLYITNTCKCRPPQNRTPKAAEVAACLPYLLSELESLSPKLIICVGLTPAKAIIDKKINISQHHGQIFTLPSGLQAMVTYHPAAALRSPALRPLLSADLEAAGRYIKG